MGLPRIAEEFYLLDDPELRFTPNGSAVCKMRVVASSRKQNSEGKWERDRSFFVTATAFGAYAENIVSSLRKGDTAIIVGRLQTEEWERDGQKRSAPGLLVDECGPALRFRETPHHDGGRSRAPEHPRGGPQAPAGGPQGSPGYSTPPQGASGPPRGAQQPQQDPWGGGWSGQGL